MKRKSILFYIIPALLILTFLIASVFAINGYVKKKELFKREFEQKSLRIARILELCHDILKRHPDLDLTEQRDYLSDFQTETAKKQAARLYELEAAYEELELEAMRKVIGNVNENPDRSEIMSYKTFSPNGFRDLHNSLQYPNTIRIQDPPVITGHPGADCRIIRLVEQRGYRLRSEAVSGILISFGRHKLQPQALEAWKKMKDEALKEGIRLGLISCYRSADRQRQIFLNLLREEVKKWKGSLYTPEEIADGELDGIINHILSSSSIPGFSKHHTGFTIDICDLSSGKDYTEFAQTDGFDWISANNYLNAKRFGFIPSFPEAATSQGPEPEAWEYVWVGVKALKKVF